MKQRDVIFSAVHFLVLAGCCFVGLFFMGFHFFPKVRLICIQLLENQALLLGWLFLMLTALLLIGFYALNRGAYFQFQTEGLRADVDAAVLNALIAQFWKASFPDANITAEAILRPQGKLKILVDIPSTLEVSLPHLQKDLSLLLEETLGYRNPVLVTLISR